MSNDTPKPAATRVNGLGPKAQKLQALRDKLAAQQNGDANTKNFNSSALSGGGKAASAGHKKTNFQRKAT